jgi:hypothetical protein
VEQNFIDYQDKKIKAFILYFMENIKITKNHVNNYKTNYENLNLKKYF